MVSAKTLFLSTRPWSFPMTAISITIGGILALLESHSFYLDLYLLVLAGSIILHAFTNVVNDYFDYKYGVDKSGAPTTKYRPHPIVSGFLTPGETLVFSLMLLLLGAAIGFYLILLRGILVALFGVIGVLLATLYTAPPVKFKYHAMGEVGIFFAFGPVMVVGSYYVQTMNLSMNAFLASIPIGILIALVAFANNLRDIEYDTSVGLRTIASLLGVSRGIKFFLTMNFLAIIGVVILVLLSILPVFTLISLIALLSMIKVSRIYKEGVPENADPLAAQIVMIFGLTFILGLIISVFLPIKVTSFFQNIVKI